MTIRMALALQRRRPRSDSGNSLLFVVFMVILTFLLLVTTTNVVVAQLKPAKTSVDAGMAITSAQAGIQDFITYLNRQCASDPSNPLPSCSPASNSNAVYGINSNAAYTDTDVLTKPGQPLRGADNAGTSQFFYWQVLLTTGSGSTIRLKSVGQAKSATNSYMTRTLIADIQESASFTDLQYYTQFETYGSDFINSFYRPRTIQFTSQDNNLTNTSLAGLGSAVGQLTWKGVCNYNTTTSTCSTYNGTCTYDATTNAACSSHHDSSICDDLYYQNTNGPGRGNDSAWFNTDATDPRRPSTAIQQQLFEDNATGPDMAYYAESGAYKLDSSGATTQVKHNDFCDATFEPNMIMHGATYSYDAYLVDRGKDTGNSANSQVQLYADGYSKWSGLINGATVSPNVYNGGIQRNYPDTDGRAKLYPPVTTFPSPTNAELPLPANAVDEKGLASCVYTGPTRIKIVGNLAYITSPLTPTGTAPCYTNTSGYSNVVTNDSAGQGTVDGSGGVINAAVPITPGADGPIIYIQNPTGKSRADSTFDSPVFNMKSNISIPASSNGNTLSSPIWDSSAYPPPSPACPLASVDPTKRRNFDCEVGLTPSPNQEDVFANLKTATDAVVNGGTPDANVATTLQTNLAAVMKPSIFAPNAPNSLNTGQVKYVLTVGTMNAGASVPTPAPAFPQQDPFFETKPGGGYSTQAKTWQITITRYSCPGVKNCTGNGQNPNPTANVIVSGNANRTTVTPASQPNTTMRFPWAGAQTSAGSYSYTDPNRDITVYDHAVGDAYVDGTINGALSIVAEHDIIVTNDVKYHDGDDTAALSTTSDALSLVANHNIRVFRPMTCKSDGDVGKTWPGYCPNDTIGIYNQSIGPANNNLPTNHPAAAYTQTVASAANHFLTSGATTVGTTDAALADGGTIDAANFTLRGSFTADNWYRGEVGMNISIVGGLYQYHRGAMSLPCQNHPYQGCQKMPGVGVTYYYDNMGQNQDSNHKRVPYLPPPVGSAGTGTWYLVSVSSY